jgi:hypothetical protein
VSLSDLPARVGTWFAALPVHTQVLLSLATVVLVVELALRRFARGTRVYDGWTRFFQGIGHVWTTVILSFVYFLSVAAVGSVMKLLRKDPLDRSLAPEATFWRSHEPNPLGPRAAARHQF